MRFLVQNRQLLLAADRYKQAEEKTDDTMTMKFLLHKDKEEKGKPSPQKQECGCPSLQSSLYSHTHAYFPTHVGRDKNKGKGDHLKRSQNN